jgi:hypothetical protein
LAIQDRQDCSVGRVMPTPPPVPGLANLSPPDQAEVDILSRGIQSATSPTGGLTGTQRLLLSAICMAMTGHPARLDLPAIEPDAFATALSARTLEFRTRIVELMVLLGLVLQPLPTEVADRIGVFATELGVDEGMLKVASEFARGSLELAAFDFERNGYTSTWSDQDAVPLHTSAALASAWDLAPTDRALAERWEALEDLPSGSLGRRVTEFYKARGFVYPGLPGSAPPLLAQHDWVHVLADYGTTVESELEVFAFIARANDDSRAFSLLAMVVCLFETGYLRTGAGLFESSPGHLSARGMASRVADAMRRGALCSGSIDFLRLDWFDLAHLTIPEVHERFGVPPKASDAVTAGSVGPWHAGGISAFQVRSGEELARLQGRPYDSYGANVV